MMVDVDAPAISGGQVPLAQTMRLLTVGGAVVALVVVLAMFALIGLFQLGGSGLSVGPTTPLGTVMAKEQAVVTQVESSTGGVEQAVGPALIGGSLTPVHHAAQTLAHLADQDASRLAGYLQAGPLAVGLKTVAAQAETLASARQRSTLMGALAKLESSVVFLGSDLNPVDAFSR